MANPLSRLVKVALVLLALGGMAAAAEKPPKIPVAIGKWTGPHAGTFKSAVRSGIGKDCQVVKPAKARVVIDGEVTEGDDKKLTVRVLVKSPKTDELVQSKEYTFAKPNVSHGMSQKMGHDLTEIARRSPE
jgi:hypothetical protein